MPANFPRFEAVMSSLARQRSRHIPVKRGQMHFLSGNLASMANGLCYAIAAQIAYPDGTVHRFCRRRRIFDADGRVCHLREVSATG
jgi:hypothetical protein